VALLEVDPRTIPGTSARISTRSLARSVPIPRTRSRSVLLDTWTNATEIAGLSAGPSEESHAIARTSNPKAATQAMPVLIEPTINQSFQYIGNRLSRV